MFEITRFDNKRIYIDLHGIWLTKAPVCSPKSLGLLENGGSQMGKLSCYDALPFTSRQIYPLRTLLNGPPLRVKAS